MLLFTPWSLQKQLFVNKSVFSPTQAQELLYEPRWPLDPSGERLIFLLTEKAKNISLHQKL
jgi:hypothetical protein